MAHFIEGRGFNKGNCFAVPEVRLTETVYKFAFFQGSVSFLVVFRLCFCCAVCICTLWFLLRILAEVLITPVYQHLRAEDLVC